MDVYYYVPVKDADYAVECGLKLSRWHDREVMINGEMKRCICGLLNPKDDAEKYNSPEFKCLKLDVAPNYCFIADKYIYLVGTGNPRIMELYYRSIVPAEKYIFGSCRLPECLVTSTIIGGNVGILDKRLDNPVLFDNSEELYLNNIIEANKEAHSNFSDTMLYFFYSRLAELEKIDKIEDNKEKIAIFTDRENSRTIIVKVPDISNF